MGVPVPEWAKVASEKFWETFGTDADFFSKLQNGNFEEIGKFVGMIDLAPKSDSPSKIDAATQALVKLIKSEATNATPDEGLKFAIGRKKAEKIPEKAEGISQRTKFGRTAAYAALSAHGRFAYWLNHAPDGIITWTDGRTT